LVNLIKTIDPEEAYRKSCKSKSKEGEGNFQLNINQMYV
jgi:hypothetical protein